MKEFLLTVALVLSAWTLHAQGVISMNTIGGRANAVATFAGTTNKVGGTQFLAQLFWGLGPGLSPAQLSAVTNAPATLATGTFAGYIVTASGGGDRVLPNPGGSVVTVQIRIWDRALGTAPPDVVAFAWNAPGTGWSQTLNVTLTEPPTPTATLFGLPSYVLCTLSTCVPEPSIWALAVLGGLGVLLAHGHRKN